MSIYELSTIRVASHNYDAPAMAAASEFVEAKRLPIADSEAHRKSIFELCKPIAARIAAKHGVFAGEHPESESDLFLFTSDKGQLKHCKAFA